MASGTVRIAPGAIFEVLDDEAILLHLESGTYYRLNATGTRLWQLIEQHQDLEQAVATMQDEFDAPPKQIREDAERIVTELISEGLLERSA